MITNSPHLTEKSDGTLQFVYVLPGDMQPLTLTGRDALHYRSKKSWFHRACFRFATTDLTRAKQEQEEWPLAGPVVGTSSRAFS